MFLSADFERVVSGLGLIAVNSMRCPDQWVGDVKCTPDGFEYIGSDSGKFNFRMNLDRVSKRIVEEKVLLIILESPHIDEYKKLSNSIFEPIGPANGVTGENIRKYLHLATKEIAIDNCCRQDLYHLFLVNAVPYQCSLGEVLVGSNKDNRNSIFLNCWNYAKHDFVERINKYCSNNSIIINACTKGVNSPNDEFTLRGVVNRMVSAMNLNNKYYKRYHPASLPNWKSERSW